MLAKCVLSRLELNWNQCFRDKKDKIEKLSSSALVVCVDTTAERHFTSSKKRTRTAMKCTKTKNARAKRAKVLFSIVKYANL